MRLDEEQTRALELMKSGRNVFLTGRAGTGKSAVLSAFREWCRRSGASSIFMAPTGVAATNIEGATIHSVLQLGPMMLMPGTIGPLRMRREKLEAIREARTLVIDEISMVRSDLFSAIDWRLCGICGTGEVFGGKQLVVVGDFHQLPPVVTNETVLELLRIAKPRERERFLEIWHAGLSGLGDAELASFLRAALGLGRCGEAEAAAVRGDAAAFRKLLWRFLQAEEGLRAETVLQELRSELPQAAYAYGVAAEGLLTAKTGGVFAFQARRWRTGGGNLWEAAGFERVALRTSHRQAADRAYGLACDAVRAGRLEEEVGEGETALEVLSRRVGEGCGEGEGEPVLICPTNRQVQAINAARQAGHEEECRRFSAHVWGKTEEKLRRAVEGGREPGFATEVELTLWPGARVMLLKNEPDGAGGYAYVNGSLGHVVGFSADGGVEVRLDSGEEVRVGTHEWAQYEHRLTPGEDGGMRVEAEAVGGFEQIPLKLAYAVTIHKAQGLTLPRMKLQLGKGCFADGQLYTALTRCPSFSGLSLDRAVQASDNHRNAAVVKFMAGV